MSSGVFCGECVVLVVGSGDKVAYRSHSSCIWCERVIFDREGSNVIFFFFFLRRDFHLIMSLFFNKWIGKNLITYSCVRIKETYFVAEINTQSFALLNKVIIHTHILSSKLPLFRQDDFSGGAKKRNAN